MASILSQSTTALSPDMEQEITASWDTAGADLILRSEADEVEFKVHKLMLIHGFQGFSDMLSGAPLLGTNDLPERTDGLPVVTLPETSAVLQKLLALIYPIEPPQLVPQSVLLDVCTALDKYCVKSYPRPVVDGLLYWAKKEPALTYIHACRFRVREVAEAALKASLGSPKLFMDVDSTQLLLSAEQYHALVVYQIYCREQAVSAVKDFAWMYGQQTLPPGFLVSSGSKKKHCSPHCETCYNTPVRLVPTGTLKSTTIVLSTWLIHYLDAVENALAKSMSGTVATNETRVRGIFNPANVVVCDSCRTADHAFGMMAFAEELKKEIDGRIATVKLSVPGF